MHTGHYFTIKAELVEVISFKIIDMPISQNRCWHGEAVLPFRGTELFATKLTKHVHVTAYLIFFIQQERHDFLEEKFERKVCLINQTLAYYKAKNITVT